MRGLFVGLLLLNAGYLAWILYQEQSVVASQPTESVRTLDKGELVLLSEFRQPMAERSGLGPVTPAPPVAASVAAPTTVVPIAAPEPEATIEDAPKAVTVNYCFKLEGIKKENEARQLLAALRERGVHGLKTGSVQSEEHRYWVKVSGGKTKKQAADALRGLKAAGLKDFYLIDGADIGNTISLGVFSTKDAAERRYNAVKALSLTPKIDEIRLPVRRWWLNTGALEEAVLEQTLQILTIRDVTIEKRPCK